MVSREVARDIIFDGLANYATLARIFRPAAGDHRDATRWVAVA